MTHNYDSFGQELEQENMAMPIRHVDKIFQQLDISREMCQLKLIEILDNGLPQKIRNRSPSPKHNDQDYYELMKRCLEAEARACKAEREVEVVRKKCQRKIQMLQAQVNWLKSNDFSSVGVKQSPKVIRNREPHPLFINTDLNE